MKLMLVMSSLALLWCVASVQAGGEGGLKVGDKAPNFKLQGSDGKDYALKDFQGKQWVVIAWFPKAFTGGCTAECKAMKSQGDKIRKYDVAYFTASVDTPELNTKFAKALDLDYPILSDPDKGIAKEFGVVHGTRTVPERWTYYIDPMGIVRAVDRSVRTGSHGEDIAAKLADLKVPEKK